MQPTSVNRFEWDAVKIFVMLYGFVVFILLFKLSLNAAALIKLKRSSLIYKKEKFTVVNANVSTVFSCFNWIFLPQKTKIEIADPIIEHEKLHAMYFHSFDLILVELFAIFFWFNPFVYLFRKNLSA